MRMKMNVAPFLGSDQRHKNQAQAKSQWLDLFSGFYLFFTICLLYFQQKDFYLTINQGKQVWSKSSAAFWIIGLPRIWVCLTLTLKCWPSLDLGLSI